MQRSTQILLTSVVAATAVSIFILRAPIIPAVLGGIAAGIWIWYRQKRT
jgi:hypothetical protein